MSIASESAIKQLKARHEAMIKDLVIGGLKNQEIEKKYNICSSRLSVLRYSPLWKAREEELQAEYSGEVVRVAKNELMKNAHKAAQRMVECLDADDEKIMLSSAKEILNRTGVAPIVEDAPVFTPTIQLFIPDSYKPKDVTVDAEQGD